MRGDKYCIRYVTPDHIPSPQPYETLAIYHMHRGMAVGIPIAFVRADMAEAVHELLRNANKIKGKSIYLRGHHADPSGK